MPKDNRKRKLTCCILLILFVLCSLMCIIFFIFIGIPAWYKIRVVDENKLPVAGALLEFEYKKNIDISGKHGKYYRENLITDINGEAHWKGFRKYNPHIQYVTAYGYYTYSSCVPLQNGENVITLTKNNHSVIMVIGERFDFPSGTGRFTYDLLRRELLPPYGNGINADIVIVISKRDKPDQWGEEYNWDFEFPGDGDGILFCSNKQRYINHRYELNDAPESGYDWKNFTKCIESVLKNIYPKVISRLCKSQMRERKTF